MMQWYHDKIARKKMSCKIRGFSTLRQNTWFLKASMEYVVLQRIAEIRGF